jgi:hypothetical protein
MGEPGQEGNLTRGQLATQEQELRALDSAANHVLVHRETRRALEHRLQVRRTDRQYPREARDGEVSIDVLFDVVR